MHSKLKAWSLIDPKPVLYYVVNSDDYIVYWNGIVMPHKMALCIAMYKFGMTTTPTMKLALLENYKKLYYANAFNTRAWDDMVRDDTGSNILNYLSKIMHDHITVAVENKTGAEVLSWFDYSRANQD